MAVRFAAAGDFLDHTAGSTLAAASTWIGWAYLTSGTGAVSTLARYRTSGDGTSQVICTTTNGVTLRLNSSGAAVVSSYAFTAGVWSKVGVVMNGASGEVHAADAGSDTIVSASGSINSGTNAKFAIGGRGASDTTERWNGRLAAVKMYSRILTLDEIRAEWTQVLPVSTAGLFAAYPLDSMATAEGRLDHSGNGRMLAAGSSITEDGPPIPRQRIVVRPWLASTAAATGAASADPGTGTGTAHPPAVAVAGAADPGTGTGTAHQASISTTGSGDAAAGLASGTGAAGQPTIVAPNAAPATAAGSGAASAAPPGIGPGGGHAAGTGSAADAILVIAVMPATATGVGSGINTVNGADTVRYHAGAIADAATHFHGGTPTL